MIESAWESLCRRRGPIWLGLLPLSLLYGLISRLLRSAKPQRVHAKAVISVGNLSMGGAGKTPLVITIGKLIAAKRRRFAVLSRGYGRDEDILLRQALPMAIVYVGADRLATAQQALASGAEVLVLDDGFQRRHQLARDKDILVLDWSRMDIEQHCLPAGRLREPLLSAVEADAVVVTHAPADWNAAAIRPSLPAPYRSLRIFRGDHSPVALRSLNGKQRRPLSWLRGREVVALSGIGKPASFEALLSAQGAMVRPRRYSDHHAFGPADLPAPGSPVVCTAKDAMKLLPLAVDRKDIWILDIEMKVSPEAEFNAWVLA